MDALFALLVIPFAYFFYESWDEESTLGTQIKDGFKYTAFFIAFSILLILIGLFIPSAASRQDSHLDLDYFKHLLADNSGERMLVFVVGVLVCLGTVGFVVYTGPGMALLPVSEIKGVHSTSSAPASSDVEAQHLLQVNREDQRAIEVRYQGTRSGMAARDRRAMDVLQRQERTLVRQVRLSNERGDRSFRGVRLWNTVRTILRPFHLILGIIALAVSLLIAVSMLISL